MSFSLSPEQDAPPVSNSCSRSSGFGFPRSRIEQEINLQKRKVYEVLKQLGLLRFLEKFREYGYDAVEYFGEITEDELQEMGLKRGHIKRWRNHLEEKVESTKSQWVPIRSAFDSRTRTPSPEPQWLINQVPASMNRRFHQDVKNEPLDDGRSNLLHMDASSEFANRRSSPETAGRPPLNEREFPKLPLPNASALDQLQDNHEEFPSRSVPFKIEKQDLKLEFKELREVPILHVRNCQSNHMLFQSIANSIPQVEDPPCPDDRIPEPTSQHTDEVGPCELEIRKPPLLLVRSCKSNHTSLQSLLNSIPDVEDTNQSGNLFPEPGLTLKHGKSEKRYKKEQDAYEHFMKEIATVVELSYDTSDIDANLDKDVLRIEIAILSRKELGQVFKNNKTVYMKLLLNSRKQVFDSNLLICLEQKFQRSKWRFRDEIVVKSEKDSSDERDPYWFDRKINNPSTKSYNNRKKKRERSSHPRNRASAPRSKHGKKGKKGPYGSRRIIYR